MKQQLKIAFWMTIVTTIIFGIVYPFLITGLAQAFFPVQANGELLRKNDVVIGSSLIGQAFPARGYFYSRPSNSDYDGMNSGGSNLGPTNRVLMERVHADVQKLHAQNTGTAPPVDLVTASASGLDPDISVAAADFQIPRVARERGITDEQVRSLVLKHTKGRQFRILGEPRVNVLELNLDLDATYPTSHSAAAPAGIRACLGGSKR